MSLDADDPLQLALASSLTGHDVECAAVLTRAHEQLARADVPKAAQCAIWLGMSLLNAMELVRGRAWLARAERLLGECGLDCVERGWVLIPRGRQRVSLKASSSALSRLIERPLLHPRSRGFLGPGDLNQGIRGRQPCCQTAAERRPHLIDSLKLAP